jgi:hypothetical protein
MKTLRYSVWWLTIVIMLSGLAGCITVTASQSTPSAPSEPPTPTAEQQAATAGQVEANGITIAYESFGPTDGETILLIAGTGQQLVD